MSIIIKGMEMPKNCGECPLAIQAYPVGNTQSWRLGCMPLGQVRTVKIRTRPDWCPLEEADPHSPQPRRYVQRGRKGAKMRLIEDIICIILLWVLPDCVLETTGLYDAIKAIANERRKDG